MENPSLIELGGGAAIAYVFIKLILDFLKAILPKKASPDSLDVATLLSIKENSYRILELVKKIHEMHDLKDEDGVYVWYVKKSVADSIHRLGDAADQLVKRRS